MCWFRELEPLGGNKALGPLSSVVMTLSYIPRGFEGAVPSLGCFSIFSPVRKSMTVLTSGRAVDKHPLPVGYCPWFCYRQAKTCGLGGLCHLGSNRINKFCSLTWGCLGATG